MNRVCNVFSELKAKGEKALITFITGGDPDIATTKSLILAMADAGADIIEIGIPFSDPVAEGIAVQDASKRALENGCTVDNLFDMVQKLRIKVSIPILFVTYANPIYAYGKQRFMARCKDTGIDGIIVPDVPFEEKDEFEGECNRHEIYLISVLAPTSGKRAGEIASEAKGFVYCISAPGITESSIPCAIEVEICTPAEVRSIAALADGVIINSAVVKLVAEHGVNSINPVQELICEVKQEMKTT